MLGISLATCMEIPTSEVRQIKGYFSVSKRVAVYTHWHTQYAKWNSVCGITLVGCEETLVNMATLIIIAMQTNTHTQTI